MLFLRLFMFMGLFWGAGDAFAASDVDVNPPAEVAVDPMLLPPPMIRPPLVRQNGYIIEHDDDESDGNDDLWPGAMSIDDGEE